MKRATSGGSASSQRGPENKKPRLDHSNANSFSVLSLPEKGKEPEGGEEWTKVEKRKQKKAKNIEAKLSVCTNTVAVVAVLICRRTTHRVSFTQAKRFQPVRNLLESQ